MLKKNLALILIICLAFLLRFYQLGGNPPGINVDEAAIGYNAYSILKTGRDEYGKFLPIVFRSHDDYKPPLYIYLAVPAIAAFGLDEFAVRFPSALLGVFAVVSVYFLVKELLPNSSPKISLLSSFSLAISPWHLQFTRAAFESGATVLFSSLGLLFFLKALRKKSALFYILSACLFGLELYLYQASKVFTPLFITTLLAFNLRQLWSQKRNLTIFLIIFLLFALPVISLSTTLAGQIRIQGTSVFQDPVPHDKNVSWQIADWLGRDRISAAAFHQPVLEYSQQVIAGYLSHFRPDFLFASTSGPPVNFVPGAGLLHLWELPFVLLGTYLIWLTSRKTAVILFSWLILSPLPASITYGVPSSIRTTIILPTYQILIAVGIFYSFAFLKKRYQLLLIPAGALFLITVIYFTAYYLHMMLVHAPIDYSDSWYYGYKDVVQETARLGKNYKKIIVSTGLNQPQNFFAFYLQYDPWTYINIDGGTVSGGFAESRNHFSKYFFQSIYFGPMSKEPGVLFVGRPRDFPGSIRPLRTFHFLNGQTSVIIVGSI